MVVTFSLTMVTEGEKLWNKFDKKYEKSYEKNVKTLLKGSE